MKAKNSFAITICLVSLITTQLQAQVAINTSGAPPVSSAILDLNSGNGGINKGFLPPQVALTDIAAAAPVSSPVTGLIVYSTTAPTGGNGTGYYYWNGSIWVSIGTGIISVSAGSPGSVTGISGLTFSSNPITSTGTLAIANTGVTAKSYGSSGYYPIFNVNAQGQLTNVDSLSLPSSNNAWNLTGNSGTNSLTNFIGTADAQDLVFKVKNQFSGIIDSAFYTTSFGYRALNVNTGYSNSAFGNLASSSNTTGSGNVSVGVSALQANKTGQGNTATGLDALQRTTNSYNAAFGYGALSNDTSGTDNVAVGAFAGSNNTSGSRNTYVQMGVSENTIGMGNTLIGWGANSSNTSLGYDYYNTAIGYLAYPSLLNANMSNTTMLGNGATVVNNNSVAIGNTSITSTWVQVDWTIGSDARIKNNIQENVPGLAFIKQLRPVTYHYNIDKENELLGVKNNENWAGKYDIEKIQFSGFIAQEVDAAAKNLGYDFSGVAKNGNLFGLRYAEFVVPLVKAVQEQEDTIQALRVQIELVNTKVQQQTSQVASVQSSEAENELITKSLQNEVEQLKKLVESLSLPARVNSQLKKSDKN